MGKVKKIIMFIHAPFCERDYNRFGVELLQDNGFEVEIWDCISFVRKGAFKKKQVPDPVNFEGHRIFSTFKEVNSAISELNENCFIIFFETYRPESYQIYRAVSKKRIPYCVSVVGGSYAPLIPSETKNEEFKMKFSFQLGYSKAINGIRRLRDFRFIKDYLFRHIPFRFLGINPANLILADAEKANFSTSPMNSNTEVLWIHYFDYDIYLKEIRYPEQNTGQNGVFLDSYLSFHPDWKALKMKTPITVENYYSSLHKFFDFLEMKHGIKIIIAAHPRSHCSIQQGFFGKRKVIRGDSARLVKESKFVLNHTSYAVNFAVLFKKPVLFLTTNELENSCRKGTIESMANALGKKVINIDKPLNIDWEKEFSIDEKKYSQFKHNHIKKNGTEELPFWQIVANRIKCF